MKRIMQGNTIKHKVSYLFHCTTGNALPLVLMLVLVVMLVGGSVAYSTMQMYTISRGGFHDQLAYIAAENAIERSISNLKKVITVQGYPGSKGVFFTGDVDSFLDSLILAINADSNIVKSYLVKVHGNLNEARVTVSFERFGSNAQYTGDRIRFPIQITAKADMEDEAFSSYGRTAVAVREIEIPVYTKFRLNGAIYTLGDLVIKGGHPTNSEHTTIVGDIYAFGTGLDKANRMEQYYTGGVCAIENSILHVEGSIFTRNLVRAGTFDDSDGGEASSASIIVDEDVVAQGVQVFGTNDNIVVIRDVYTFDDVEMNGANSYIAINGNFFGLNPGDGSVHDSSSAMVNMAPTYGTDQPLQESRIAINGQIFANGVTFRVFNDEITGEKVAGHKLESVAMAFRDGVPLYEKENIPGNASTNEYLNKLNDAGEKKGFSVLWGVTWTYGSVSDDWELWTAWINQIKAAANYQNNIGITIPSAGNLKGYAKYGFSANNRFYKYDDDDYDASEIKGTDSVTLEVADKVAALKTKTGAKDMLNLEPLDWEKYNSEYEGLPSAMKELMDYLLAHVSVFSSKTLDNTGTYQYGFHLANSETGKTEFNRIKDLLGNESEFPHNPYDRCIIRLDGNDSGIYYLNNELQSIFGDKNGNGIIDPEENYKNYYFLVVNLNSNKEIRVTDKFNGIIFSLGKVVVERNGEVNGAIIAAGKGFKDSGNGVEQSAADVDDSGNARLPRVVIADNPTDFSNISAFTSWQYAALEIENGGNVYFPGSENLLKKLKENIDVSGTNRSLDLFEIFDVEEPSP